MVSFRAFVAIPLPEDVRERLAALQERLRPARADVKWVEPGLMHVTLRFLGDLADGARPALEAGLRAAATGAAPIDLEARGLGAFPASGAPRVVWAGLAEREPGRLAALASAVEGAAAAAGFPPETRPFTAHVTLGRAKSPRNAAALRALLAGAGGDAGAGAFRMEAFVLYRSDLSPQGPTYTAVERFPLGKPS
jgi:2'-5' RNA ligase